MMEDEDEDKDRKGREHATPIGKKEGVCAYIGCCESSKYLSAASAVRLAA